jgi:hypothetical protein
MRNIEMMRLSPPNPVPGWRNVHAAFVRPLKEKSMKNFGKIAVLALFVTAAAGPALAQSNSGGAMSNGSMSNGAMANDHMASGSMSAGAMSDHDKMAKPKKKKGAMTSGAMSGSMSSGSMSGGSMSNSTGH